MIDQHGERLREWIALGAAVYVCGSLQGMAAGVDAALVAVLATAGRYRRHVY